MASRSLVLALVLAMPATAVASTGDAQRFGRFAQRAHATGTIKLVLQYKGIKEAGCDAAGTCGVAGKVTAKLTMDPGRKVAALPGGIAVLPGKGTITASVTNPQCSDRLKLTSAGVAFAGDKGGLLLRPGAFVAGSGTQDPFQTRCAGPAMADLGKPDILPAVRLKKVPSGVSDVHLRFSDHNDLQRAGYAEVISVSGDLHLRDK
jgi:hypothetical protein